MAHAQDPGAAASARPRTFLRARELSWDDDTVLTRQFSALVPAFDPRPGRENVQAVRPRPCLPALLHWPLLYPRGRS